MVYVAKIIRYTDRPRNGNYRLCGSINAVEFRTFDKLTSARKYAFQRLSHNTLNGEGKYMCIVSKGWNEFKGEIMNTAYDERYWYPSKDGVYASAGKYVLYKDGSLGKKLR